MTELIFADTLMTMKQMGISRILTHDNHFTQEGFVILFVDNR